MYPGVAEAHRERQTFLQVGTRFVALAQRLFYLRHAVEDVSRQLQVVRLTHQLQRLVQQ